MTPALPVRSEFRPTPQQGRAVRTRERLLDVAGALLAEVGIERISTNLVCERAGLTPPALYRYFRDKYALLAALGERLMARQNAVLERWLERPAPEPGERLAAHVEALLRETARVTAAEPGGAWIERALRAVPQLAEVRIASHRYVTDRMFAAFSPRFPALPREVLWRRVRLAVEFGYAVDEMLHEESLIARDDLLREAARTLVGMLADEGENTA